MVGYIADVAFYKVPDPAHITGLNWRLMLASACVPPLIVCSQIYFSVGLLRALLFYFLVEYKLIINSPNLPVMK